MKSTDIVFRDPFVLVHNGRYYLYGTTDDILLPERGLGFFCHVSDNLDDFSEAVPVFRPDASFWGTQRFWAPEVHRWQGAFYLFATFHAEGVHGGTQILRGESPLGPFAPISNGPVTPADWECLDGTLHIDDDGRPWLVFCHEWVQIHDGTICALPLADDLTHAIGTPVTLFAASQCPWVVPVITDHDYVTDAPFLFRHQNSLCMLWSSISSTGYALGLAISESGRVAGPWRFWPKPLFADNGGHGMIFTSLDGKRFVSLHAPNNGGPPHPLFIPADQLLPEQLS